MAIETQGESCVTQSGIGTTIFFRETDRCDPAPADTAFTRLGNIRKVEPPGLKTTWDKVTYLDPEYLGWKQALATHEKEANGFSVTADHAGKKSDGAKLIGRAAVGSILLDCKIQSQQSGEYLEFQVGIEELKWSPKEGNKTETVTIKFVNAGSIPL